MHSEWEVTLTDTVTPSLSHGTTSARASSLFSTLQPVKLRSEDALLVPVDRREAQFPIFFSPVEVAEIQKWERRHLGVCLALLHAPGSLFV